MTKTVEFWATVLAYCLLGFHTTPANPIIQDLMLVSGAFIIGCVVARRLQH